MPGHAVAGGTVAIHAATGGVGRLALQLARVRGHTQQARRRRFALAEPAQAHALIERGTSTGKVVLTVSG